MPRFPFAGPLALARDQQHPSAIALDEDAVYWTDAVAGTVMKVDRRGGTPVALARRLRCPLSLAVDATSVWVTTHDEDGAVLRIGKNDGAVAKEVVGSQVFPQCIAVDEHQVYWTNGGDDHDNGTVCSVSRRGGAINLLATGEVGPQGLGLDSDGVYWLTRDDHIRRVAKSGGEVHTLHCPSEAVEELLAQGGQTSSAGQVLSTRPPRVRRIVVDEEQVYWRDVSMNICSAIYTGNAPQSGSTSVLVVEPDGPSDVAFDAEHVYWTDPILGRVLRVSRVGGRGEVCAPDEPRSLAIAVDAQGLYWSIGGARGGDGAIKMLPRAALGAVEPR